MDAEKLLGQASGHWVAELEVSTGEKVGRVQSPVQEIRGAEHAVGLPRVAVPDEKFICPRLLNVRHKRRTTGTNIHVERVASGGVQSGAPDDDEIRAGSDGMNEAEIAITQLVVTRHNGIAVSIHQRTHRVRISRGPGLDGARLGDFDAEGIGIPIDLQDATDRSVRGGRHQRAALDGIEMIVWRTIDTEGNGDHAGHGEGAGIGIAHQKREEIVATAQHRRVEMQRLGKRRARREGAGTRGGSDPPLRLHFPAERAASDAVILNVECGVRYALAAIDRIAEKRLTERDGRRGDDEIRSGLRGWGD